MTTLRVHSCALVHLRNARFTARGVGYSASQQTQRCVQVKRAADFRERDHYSFLAPLRANFSQKRGMETARHIAQRSRRLGWISACNNYPRIRRNAIKPSPVRANNPYVPGSGTGAGDVFSMFRMFSVNESAVPPVPHVQTYVPGVKSRASKATVDHVLLPESVEPET